MNEYISKLTCQSPPYPLLQPFRRHQWPLLAARPLPQPHQGQQSLQPSRSHQCTRGPGHGPHQAPSDAILSIN